MTDVGTSALKRGTNLFYLDTKSTCFLCLSEIPVVTKLESKESEERKSEQEEHLSMRLIHKYLKLHAGKLLSSKITGEANNNQLLKTDLAVKLCDSCKRMTGTLSKLCLELEVVQMKVDHWLKQVMDTLKKSEEDREQMLKFQSKMTQLLDLFQFSVANMTRKEMITKGSQRLKKREVGAIVDMTTGKKASIKPNSVISIPRLFSNKCASQTTPSTKMQSHTTPQASTLSGVPLEDTLATQTPEMLPAPAPLPFLSPPNGAPCLAATATVTTPSPPPVISVSQLTPSTPPFTVLKTKSSSSKQNEHGKNSKFSTFLKNASINCPLCRIPFSSTSAFNSHCSLLHPNTKGLQPIRIISPTPFVCNVCGLKFPIKPDWIRHTRLECTGKQDLTAINGQPASTTQLNSVAQNNGGVQQEVSLVPNVQNDRNWPRSRDSPRTDIDTGGTHICEGCGKGFAKRKNMKAHIRQGRCSVLSAEPPGGWEYYCKVCKMGFYKLHNLRVHVQQAKCQAVRVSVVSRATTRNLPISFLAPAPTQQQPEMYSTGSYGNANTEFTQAHQVRLGDIDHGDVDIIVGREGTRIEFEGDSEMILPD